MLITSCVVKLLLNSFVAFVSLVHVRLCREEDRIEETRRLVIFPPVNAIILSLLMGMIKVLIQQNDEKEMRAAFTLFNYVTVSRLDVQSASPHNEAEAGPFRIW